MWLPLGPAAASWHEDGLMNVQARHADRLRHSEEIRKRHFTLSGQQISLVGCFWYWTCDHHFEKRLLCAFCFLCNQPEDPNHCDQHHEQWRIPPPPPHSPQLEHTETICFSATSSQKNNPCIQISIHWGQTQRQKNKIKETNSLHKCDSKSLLTWLAFPSSNSHAAVYLVRYSIVKL